jgi:hypothetical protein
MPVAVAARTTNPKSRGLGRVAISPPPFGAALSGTYHFEERRASRSFTLAARRVWRGSRLGEMTVDARRRLDFPSLDGRLFDHGHVQPFANLYG